MTTKFDISSLRIADVKDTTPNSNVISAMHCLPLLQKFLKYNTTYSII